MQIDTKQKEGFVSNSYNYIEGYYFKKKIQENEKFVISIKLNNNQYITRQAIHGQTFLSNFIYLQVV